MVVFLCTSDDSGGGVLNPLESSQGTGIYTGQFGISIIQTRGQKWGCEDLTNTLGY